MNIVVCCKLVPEEQDIQVGADRSISYAFAERKIGDYDLVAIEAAAQLAEATDGTLCAVSVGDDFLNNSKLRKAILSKGPDSLSVVTDTVPEQLDSFQTASILKSAIKALGDVDLVVCGEGSADVYAQQVGMILGELLDWSTLNAVSKAEMESGSLIVDRALEDRIETLKISLPAVVSVSADYAEPRIASMKEILAAGKKPVEEHAAGDFGALPDPAFQVVSVLAPISCERAEVIIEGSDDEQIAAFVENLCAHL